MSASFSSDSHGSETEMREQRSPGISRAAQQTPSDAQRQDEAQGIPPPTRVGDKLLYDITRHLRDAAKDLPIGSLVQSSSFALHEAVGAIEVMNPRMDTGYLQDQGASLDDEFDFDATLSALQVLGIIDELICLEMAWHQGHPLLQTVFTSRHIDKLLSSEASELDEIHFSEKQAEHWKSQPWMSGLLSMSALILRTYCMATIACCQNVIDRVVSGNPIYYEDEDISTNTFGRDMFTRFDRDTVHETIYTQLHQVLSWLDALPDIILIKAKWDGEICEGINARLACRLRFMEMTFEEPDHVEKYTHEAHPFGDSIRTSHWFVKDVPLAFSDKIQCRLASTQPPRPTVKPEFSVALEQLMRLFKDCEEATQLLEIPLGKESIFDDPWEVEYFVNAFMLRKPEPLPFIRSYVQALVIRCIGKDDMPSWQRFLNIDLAQTVLPLLLGSDKENALQAREGHYVQMWKVVDDFGQRAIPAQYGFADYYRILCQNRCRLRRLLTHHVRFLDGLQLSITERQSEIQAILPEIQDKIPLEIWISFRKYRSLEQIIKLGFEQDVYDVLELEDFYMTLAMFSCSTLQYLRGMLDNMQYMQDVLRNTGSGTKNVELAVNGLTLNDYQSQRDHVIACNITLLYRCYRYLGLVKDTHSIRTPISQQLRAKHMRHMNTNEILPVFHEQEDPTSNMDAEFEKAKENHKKASSVWAQQRKLKEQLAAVKLPNVIKEHEEKSSNERGIRVLVDIGLAREKLRKVWQEGTVDQYHLVFPPMEDRKDPAWIVPKLELKPIRQQSESSAAVDAQKSSADKEE